ncbi:hypothetical protein GCM10023203_44860 [Actinomycetospora straminea]|uniref:Uncharacterized protein n=1 Tax=Actinomycetospora straminea TaxID=663607 RepID=A0ABP9EU91_9PSEU
MSTTSAGITQVRQERSTDRGADREGGRAPDRPRGGGPPGRDPVRGRSRTAVEVGARPGRPPRDARPSPAGKAS